jgi:hypothetical protein
MTNASEERFLVDRGADAKRASRTSWGEESYVKVASTLSNNAYSSERQCPSWVKNRLTRISS